MQGARWSGTHASQPAGAAADSTIATASKRSRCRQAFIGRSLRDINLRKNYNVSVLAAGPENRLTVNPPASHVLNENELLVVMGAVRPWKSLPSQ
jgi:K+/H+ antiporter YhaU regulatory subunit KhtT